MQKKWMLAAFKIFTWQSDTNKSAQECIREDILLAFPTVAWVLRTSSVRRERLSMRLTFWREGGIVRILYYVIWREGEDRTAMLYYYMLLLLELIIVGFMGGNYQDGKYALFVSFFVSFPGDLESKWAIREPNKKYLVDKFTKERDAIALFYCKLAPFNSINN